MRCSFKVFIISSIFLTQNINCKTNLIHADVKRQDLRKFNPNNGYLVLNGFSKDEGESAFNQLNSFFDADGMDIQITKPTERTSLREENLSEELINAIKKKMIVRNQKVISSSDSDSSSDDGSTAKMNRTIGRDLIDVYSLVSGNNVNTQDRSDSREFSNKTKILRGMDCSRSAEKACASACRKVLKRACQDYRCKSGMKSMFRKECKKNCNSRFKQRNTLKEK